MHNNYLLLEGAAESTLPRETAFHAAGHALGEHLFLGSSPGDFWRHARLRASEAGAIEAISQVVTSLSFDVDIAVAQGENTLGVHPHDEHLIHLIGREICVSPEDREIAWILLDDESWFETASLIVLQRHWWAVSNLAERWYMGEVPDEPTITRLLRDERCSPYAWERTEIPH